MQTARILQAVVLMMIVALAASCAASKEYTSKLFSPRDEAEKDSRETALRFLDLDSISSQADGWVTTDIIMGREIGSKTRALDKLTKTFPAASQAKDTAVSLPIEKSAPVLVETKPVESQTQPIARNYDPAETRNKRTRD